MKKKTIIGGVVVLVLLVSALVLWVNSNRPPVVNTYTVLEGPYEEVVSAIGYVDYEKEVIVSTQVGGIIREVAHDAGDRVDREALLITIDDNEARSIYEDLQTSLRLAQARLNDYQSIYGNNRNNTALQKDVLDYGKLVIMQS
ncbi:conserved protein of unknown function [Petrocella atlantisensis]|uniref:Membrane fusion protein biotin-lipoyl like domain-containing protein n=1 Tax=Petrocella atlantisensis TaxID=2173034 RepID=A0A3P7NXK4_9FIRM|nr:HlyD family efflux transporter periplasmic adaptor subunit [Petrocella atlantisensis]VDN47944.1 conserved protein of unknown function [Petrocella atlantisensis]